MKKVLHKAGERGGGDYGWLRTNYSFSFASWYDPTRMGFGVLRVINDDWIAPHQGFGAHPHKDMEIITIVTSGVLSHQDSMGNAGTIPAGDVQVMSAGSGVVHAEENRSDEPLTLFQMWIEAKEKNTMPRYEQRAMRLDQESAGARLVVGPPGTLDALTINQDAFLYQIVLLEGGVDHYVPSTPGRGIYFFVLDGDVTVAEEELHARDALGLEEAEEVVLSSSTGARVLVFDVPMP